MEPTLTATLTREEKFLMMLYCTGSRQGLERELEGMRKALEPDEKRQAALTDRVLEKLGKMTDQEFQQIDLYEACEGL